MNETAKYGVVLRHRISVFEWKRDPTWEHSDEGPSGHPPHGDSRAREDAGGVRPVVIRPWCVRVGPKARASWWWGRVT